MQAAELIALIHHEVKKSYEFLLETRPESPTGASVLHITLERVEVELPVTLGQEDIVFEPAKMKGCPMAARKLVVPFSLKSVGQKGAPRKRMQGKTVSVEVVGHLEKLDERMAPESVGRIKVIFKPVIA